MSLLCAHCDTDIFYGQNSSKHQEKQFVKHPSVGLCLHEPLQKLPFFATKPYFWKKLPLKKIGLLSDTHSFLPHAVFDFFKDCDEIWHGGDIGNIQVAEKLAAFKPLKAVYGNIDGNPVRERYPLNLFFQVEEVKVFITHIAGYPGKYQKRIVDLFKKHPVDILVCGHSHILKVMKDVENQHLHINPGAAGIQGFHQYLTAIRFKIEGKRIFDLEVNNICLRNQVSEKTGILFDGGTPFEANAGY